jgi:hypothetical protein
LIFILRSSLILVFARCFVLLIGALLRRLGLAVGLAFVCLFAALRPLRFAAIRALGPACFAIVLPVCTLLAVCWLRLSATGIVLLLGGWSLALLPASAAFPAFRLTLRRVGGTTLC